MGPINYLGMLPQYDFGQTFANGLRAGAGIGEIQDQADAGQLALQQKQLAMQRAAQYQADVSAALAAPMDQQPQLFSALALRNPEQYEAINKSFATLGADQQKNELRSTYGVASALKAGRSDLALQQIDDLITAHKNSGQPTGDLEGLRTRVEADPNAAYGQVLHLVSGLNGGADVLKNLQSISKDARDQSESDATVASKQADNALKNIGIVAQKAGALAKPGVKPIQAETMFRTLAAQGVIPKADLQGYIDGIPSDPKALPDYLRQVQTSGLTAAEQTKYTTPDANAKLQASTSITTTAMNNDTSVKVANIGAQARKDAREIALTHGVKGLTDEQNEALFGKNGAVTTGKLDPKKINSRTAALFADAALKNPDIDFSRISSDINSSRKADTEFATGKAGNAIRSFNVGISHLDTLNNLADALNNGDLKAFNQIGNFIATQTGQPAPTNFGAAKKIVGDELVKAIVGAGGTGHDREEVAKTIDAANSPAQLKGAIKTVQELMVGQLGGLEQQYRTTTKRDDFDKYLSPRAMEIRRAHGGTAGSHGSPTAAASSIPTGWTVTERH